jgi:hypothetical protein
VLDIDTIDLQLHGKQEGRFFHGYYDSYCYLPLYIFCGEHVLCARLREANHDASFDSLLRRIIGAEMHAATEQWKQTGKPARVFSEFQYQTKKGGWARERAWGPRPSTLTVRKTRAS